MQGLTARILPRSRYCGCVEASTEGFFFSRACGYYAMPLKFQHARGLPDVSHGSSCISCTPGVDPDGMSVQGGDRRRGTTLGASVAECMRNSAAPQLGRGWSRLFGYCV